MVRDNNQQVLLRRDALKAAGAATLGTSLAGCTAISGGQNASGGGDEPYKATIPEAALELGTMPHMAAVRELMPEKTDEKYTGEIRRFENVRLMLTALNAGGVDVYTNAPANLYFAQAAGNDYRIIAPKVLGTDYYIVGHKEKAPTLKSFVERPDELTFAINQKGNIDHLQVVGVYDQEGMDFSKASTVNVGGSSGRIKSFLAGRTQGFTCHIGQFQRLKSDGEPVKLLAKVSDYFPNFVQSCVAAPADKLDDSTFDAWTQAYVNAIFRANKKAMNDFDWIFKMAEKYQAQPLDREEAKASWDVLKNDMHAWQYETFEEKPFKSVKTMLTESGQLKSDVDVDEMFEPKYAKKAMEQL